MTEQVQSALICEAAKQGATPIDPEVLRAFPNLETLDPSDAKAIASAIKALAEEHPALFQREKAWSDLDPGTTAWREREQKFRESLRKSRPVGPNEFSALDCAVLGPEELQALERHLGGCGNSYDRSVLQRALAEQNQLLGGAHERN